MRTQVIRYALGRPEVFMTRLFRPVCSRATDMAWAKALARSGMKHIRTRRTCDGPNGRKQSALSGNQESGPSCQIADVAVALSALARVNLPSSVIEGLETRGFSA